MRGLGLHKQWLAHRLISILLGFDQHIHFTAQLAISTLLLGFEPDFRIAVLLRKPLCLTFVGQKASDVEFDLRKEESPQPMPGEFRKADMCHCIIAAAPPRPAARLAKTGSAEALFDRSDVTGYLTKMSRTPPSPWVMY